MTTAPPLQGMRVIDLADVHGELCGRLLADLGAEVIRVEPPQGAASRALPPFYADQSLHFAHRNANKRTLALDLEQESDRARLHELLARADVLIESFAPGTLARLGLAPDELGARHPQLVVTSISHFGQSGPYRDWVATDAVLASMGGMVFKAGILEKPPLLPPATLAEDTAATSAAFATLLACWDRLTTGRGQHIDVSSLLAVAQATDWSFAGASAQRAGGNEPVELRNGSGPIYTIYACKGGYVRLVVLSPRQWRAMRAWLGDPPELHDPSLDGFIGRLMKAPLLGKLYTELFSTLTPEQASSEAQRRGIVCTPVLRPEQVTRNEHLVSRHSFVHAELAEGVTGPVASGFFEIDGERQGFRERVQEIGLATPFDSTSELPSWTPSAGGAPARALPLRGLRVLDFGIGGVGVECGRLLAEYGADVIKIESRSYPDFIRTVMGSEMNAPFASSSRSKRGFGVDAKHPEGLALLHRLVEQADVVIENNSTGTMDDLGLGYAKLAALNPRICMVSSQLLGSRGAWASWIGYGPSTQPLGGLVHLWNYDDQDFPAGGGSIFPDHFAGRVCAVATLASLLRRARTGRGAHAEVAQIEAVTGLLGAELFKAALAPGSVRPLGNRSERGAPWGVYPCAGEQQWCAISVRDDADWRGLCDALGKPDWAAASALATLHGRLAAHDAIEGELAQWTRTRDKNEVARLLQSHGVPAGPVFTACDQLDDPHFNARGYPRALVQQDLGPLHLEGPFFQASRIDGPVIFQAPRLGEHTREICAELLGLDDAEIDRLFELGVLEGPRTD